MQQNSEAIWVSPTYTQCNRQSIIFPTVSNANRFVGLTTRIVRKLHGNSAVTQKIRAVFSRAAFSAPTKNFSPSALQPQLQRLRLDALHWKCRRSACNFRYDFDAAFIR